MKTRLQRLPEEIRRELVAARTSRGWSQRELGGRVGIPQAHISAIETGKRVPRFDTLLDIARVLDRDLLIIPRALVPAVKALVRDFQHPEQGGYDDGAERALYAVSEDDEDADAEAEPDG